MGTASAACQAGPRDGCGRAGGLCALLMTVWPAITIAGGAPPLHHSLWTQRDGAPAEIEALAQTTDGYLWIGADSGLVRFDGVDFDLTLTRELPHKNITVLLADPDGGLWIGYRRGGLSLLRDGRLTHYGVMDGLPEGGVFAIARDHDGAMWIAAGSGLVRRQEGVWSSVTGDEGYPGRRPVRLLVDRDGDVWIVDVAGIFRFHRGGGFEHVDDDAGVNSHLAQTSDGSIWASDPLHGLRRLSGGGAPPLAPIGRSGVLHTDRAGRLWISTLPGLVRVDAQGRALPSVDDAVSAASVMSMLEDREGNVWLGTRRGLERLRPAKFASVAVPDSLHALAAADREAMSCVSCPTLHASLFLAMAPADNGGIWVGSRHQLLRVEGEPSISISLPARVSAAYRDPDGVLWIGGESALWRVSPDRIESIALPAAVDDPQDQVQSMMRDAEGGLWVSIARKGVYRYADGVWTLSGGFAELPERPAIAMLADREGRLWFSYKESRIAMFDGSRLRIFAAEDNLNLGPILSLYERGGRVWAGGERGVVSFDGTRFHVLTGNDGDAFHDVSGVVETAAGELWLSGAEGAMRIAADELTRFAHDPEYRVRYERFDYRDGLDGSASLFRPLPTLIEGDDGRLWFATNTALAWIDPSSIVRNPLPPPVLITGLLAGGEIVAPADGQILSRGTTQLQINYSALSLSMPERVRFRYRLAGVDAGWQDAGTRRSAFYTNLGRGPHHFQITASNEDGLWNEQGAELHFSIAPTLTQTLWFRVACGLLLFGLLWFLYLLRMRQVSERIRLHFEARQTERERIARELHDTLLQGFHGVILRLQAVMLQITDAATRSRMEQALERADTVLIDARDRVRLLRGGDSGGDDLSRSVAQIAAELLDGGDPAFRVIEQGASRPLAPLVSTELYVICREALFNVVQHAGAQSIEAEIAYGSSWLRVMIRDDGCGIDAAVLAAGGRSGHFGLPGMRERADRIGAKFEIFSREGLGTEVSVRVPALIAYAAISTPSLGLRLRRLLFAADFSERAGPPA
jgi:signal transduction histidine kinase/ligand-binding sensor domain-containing protein